MRTITFIALLLIMAWIIITNLSCAVCPHPGGPVNEKRVQRHDRKPFRASVVLKDGGSIAQSLKYERSVLISVKRTMHGYKHLFLTDSGDSIYKTEQKRFKVGECYMVMKNI